MNRWFRQHEPMVHVSCCRPFGDSILKSLARNAATARRNRRPGPLGHCPRPWAACWAIDDIIFTSAAASTSLASRRLHTAGGHALCGVGMRTACVATSELGVCGGCGRHGAQERAGDVPRRPSMLCPHGHGQYSIGREAACPQQPVLAMGQMDLYVSFV